jgi:hypothetical protein
MYFKINVCDSVICCDVSFAVQYIYKSSYSQTRLTAASDKVYQWLAHGRWFSPDTPASSTTKTGGHDIAEIFLKVALKHKKIKKKSVIFTM